MTAAFNWLSQSRKDIVRNNVRDVAIHELCTWDVAVGESELFPFDVTKKVDEIKKTKKLGASYTSHYKAKRFNARPSQKGNFRYNSYKPNKKKKSFLGSSNNQAHKKKK